MIKFTITEELKFSGSSGSWNPILGAIKIVPPNPEDDSGKSMSYIYIGDTEHCVLYILSNVEADDGIVHPLAPEDIQRLRPGDYQYDGGIISTDRVKIRLVKPRLAIPMRPDIEGEPLFDFSQLNPVRPYLGLLDARIMRARSLDAVFIYKGVEMAADGVSGVFQEIEVDPDLKFAVPIKHIRSMPMDGDVYVSDRLISVKNPDQITAVRLANPERAEMVYGVYSNIKDTEFTKTVNMDLIESLAVFLPDIFPHVYINTDEIHNERVSTPNDIFEDFPKETKKIINAHILYKVLRTLRKQEVMYHIIDTAMLFRSGALTVVLMLMSKMPKDGEL